MKNQKKSGSDAVIASEGLGGGPVAGNVAANATNTATTSALVPVRDGLPNDYEPCGVCGFDHAYEMPYAAGDIEALHVANERAAKRV